MERFQQENRHNGSVNTGLWDGRFANSTLQKRDPTAGQNALSTRDSRVGANRGSNSTRKHAVAPSFDAGDEDSSSTDEIDFLSQPRAGRKPTSQKKTASQTVTKAKKGETTSNELPSRSAKTQPATVTIKLPMKKKQVTTDSEDEISMTPARPVAKKQVIKKPEAPRAKAHPRTKKDVGDNAQKKEVEKWKRIPTTDVEEITASEEEGVGNVFKGKITPRRKGPLKTQYTPRPFPMDLSEDSPMAGSSRATSSTPHISSLRPKLVASSSTKSRQKAIESPNSSDFDAGEPSFTYTQAVKLNEVDPKSLCPFCDDKLPETPSSILLNMLEKLKQKAKPDPRYGNSLGLKLDMSQYISFCSRHTAESEEFPRGQKYGWPATLDAPKLVKRIWKLQSQLQDIIDDPEEGTFFAPLQETALKYGKGAVTGAKGSWATFENATTGYYGEQGLALITHVLFDMFPSIPSEKISPLDLASYFSLVLVPETALLLIQDDLQLKKGKNGTVTRSQALKILRKSTKYGLAIFPVAEGNQPNAGDDIARQRARKMRKLRDQEEEDELRRTSSQVTEIDTDGVVLNLSSDPEEADNQKTPRQRKRRAHPSPLEDVNGGSKAVKRRAQENAFRKSVEPSPPPVERKVPKKRNLTGQPGSLAWSSGPSASSTARRPAPTTPASKRDKDPFNWLIGSSS